jgi:hypothetical protein
VTCGTGDGMTPEEQFIPYRPTNLRDTTPIQQGQVRRVEGPHRTEAAWKLPSRFSAQWPAVSKQYFTMRLTGAVGNLIERNIYCVSPSILRPQMLGLRSVRTNQFCRIANMTATRQGLICDQNTITPMANLTYLINGACMLPGVNFV